MYDIVVMVAYAAGWLGAGFFVFTWIPLALIAWRSGQRDLGVLRIIDYAGVMFVAFLFLSLTLLGLLQDGVQPVPDVGTFVRRLALLALVDMVVGVRAATWARALWQARHSSVHADPLIDHVDQRAR